MPQKILLLASSFSKELVDFYHYSGHPVVKTNFTGDTSLSMLNKRLMTCILGWKLCVTMLGSFVKIDLKTKTLFDAKDQRYLFKTIYWKKFFKARHEKGYWYVYLFMF